MQRPILTSFEQGWSYIETGITKLKRILEGEPEPELTPSQYMNLYTTVYYMCIPNPPHDYSQQLYDSYRQVIEDYCNQTVLPSLRNKNDENMLKELALRWSNHKLMVTCLSKIFGYVDRFFVSLRNIPTLNQVGLRSFRDLVYNEMRCKATEAIIALIHKEREGVEIDRALLRNVLEMYVEIGIGKMDRYVDDFETFMLQDTASYYSRKASSWIHASSCPEYYLVLHFEECLKKERERVTHYLHLTTEPKLVKVLKEVFEIFSNKTKNPSPEDLMGRLTI